MISFGVDNLYTNVPVAEAISITLNMMYKQPHRPAIPFDKKQMKRLLEIAVCNVPFRFQEKTTFSVMESPWGNH